MNRRSFLGAMLAACAAPAIVRAESLMRSKPVLPPGVDFKTREQEILELFERRIRTMHDGMRAQLNETLYSGHPDGLAGLIWPQDTVAHVERTEWRWHGVTIEVNQKPWLS